MMFYARYYMLFFFFKQKTAYEMRISDWSSGVCSSDLAAAPHFPESALEALSTGPPEPQAGRRHDEQDDPLEADHIFADRPGQQLFVDHEQPFHRPGGQAAVADDTAAIGVARGEDRRLEIGRGSCRERVLK